MSLWQGGRFPTRKKDTDGSNDCEIKNDDNSNDNDSNFKEWAIEKMIVDLQSLLARGFKQKDIAVLSNTNREGQLAISRIMKWNIENPDKQMKVVSEESLLVISSPAVRIVVNILKMLDRCEAHNEDGREMPMVLRRFEANRSEGMDTSEAFEDAIVSKDEDIADYIDRLYETSKSACLDSVVEQIIKSQLSKQMTEENTPYLLALPRQRGRLHEPLRVKHPSFSEMVGQGWSGLVDFLARQHRCHPRNHNPQIQRSAIPLCADSNVRLEFRPIVN